MNITAFGQIVKLDRDLPLVRLDTLASERDSVFHGERVQAEERVSAGEMASAQAPAPEHVAATAPEQAHAPASVPVPEHASVPVPAFALAGTLVRAKHATTLLKTSCERATIGDKVRLTLVEQNSCAIIEEILPRTTAFVRRDPGKTALPQVLAANFDHVIIMAPITKLHDEYLERALVIACQTGARVSVLLTKADLAAPETVRDEQQRIQQLVGAQHTVAAFSSSDARYQTLPATWFAPGSLSVLLGKSGVGKSTLTNILAGERVAHTQEVRARDGKGRHTTVSRSIITLASNAGVIDMPGIRGLGLYDAHVGLARAFSDIEDLAAECKFRNCSHTHEPHCAVQQAIEQGVCSKRRLQSYLRLRAELHDAAGQ